MMGVLYPTKIQSFIMHSIIFSLCIPLTKTRVSHRRSSKCFAFIFSEISANIGDGLGKVNLYYEDPTRQAH